MNGEFTGQEIYNKLAPEIKRKAYYGYLMLCGLFENAIAQKAELSENAVKIFCFNENYQPVCFHILKNSDKKYNIKMEWITVHYDIRGNVV